jgi:hypothetical protein
MTTRSLPLFGIALLLTATLFAIGASPSVYAEPQLGQGCQCHNNGIALWFNQTGFNEFSAITIASGKSFVLNATSANYAASGVVPGVQQWIMNMSDTAKFTISPQNVSLKSPLNITHIKVNSTISAFYKITAPTQAGTYHLAFYAEGTTNGISVIVTGSTTTTTTTGSSQTGTSTSSSGTQTSSQSQTSSTQTQSSSSQTSSSSATTTTQTTTKSTKPVPDVTYYSGELALIVIGFSIFVAVALMRYRKS